MKEWIWMIIIKILGAVLVGLILSAVVSDISDIIESEDNPDIED